MQEDRRGEGEGLGGGSATDQRGGGGRSKGERVYEESAEDERTRRLHHVGEGGALDGFDVDDGLVVGVGVAEDGEGDDGADLEFFDVVEEVFDGLDFLAVDLGDEVAEDQGAVAAAHAADEAGLAAGAFGRGLHDEGAFEGRAFGGGGPGSAAAQRADGLVFGDGDADGRPQDAAVANELIDDAADGVDGDREADARVGAARREDGGVDADQTALGVEKRAS
mmetsp:Transcript_3423/g.10472  ORF Transcript_3423/g.10472 Transcript_3423/m.10472 type:complete len:222 (+) Transcript_3423:98-763(+)